MTEGGLGWRPEITRADRSLSAGVSVVMPVHGDQPFLGAQLRALSGQTYTGWWELLVCDNGCTDATLATVAEWSDSIPNLRRVDCTAKRGACFARNRGVEEAKGDLILICDSDDIVSAGWIQAMVETAQEAEMVGGYVDFAALNTPRAQAWRIPLTDGALPVQLEYMPFAVGCNMAVWRDAYLAVGGCDEEVVGGSGGDDVDLSWRIQLAGGRLAYAPDAVVHYRLRSDLRSLARQMYGYGQSSALLYRNYRRHGARRVSAGSTLHFWLHVLRRGPRLIRDPDAGGRKLMEIAYHLGQLRGALRYRVVYW